MVLPAGLELREPTPQICRSAALPLSLAVVCRSLAQVARLFTSLLQMFVTLAPFDLCTGSGPAPRDALRRGSLPTAADTPALAGGHQGRCCGSCSPGGGIGIDDPRSSCT